MPVAPVFASSEAMPVSVSQLTLNDPGFTSNPSDVDREWGLAAAKFSLAWEKTVGSHDNVVAVVDTGIDETHEDLQQINFVKGFNFITNQPIDLKINSDDNGHGTLVAGILGATPANGIGIAGTNWKISIMPIKALDSHGKGDASTIAQAIVWATDHGAQIINLSLSGIGLGHDVSLSNAISYAFNHNALIVAAAGNDVATTGGNLDNEPQYPVCDDNGKNMVLGVAATDFNDQKAVFSDYGAHCVDVSAPGKRILSTINYDPLTKTAVPNSYAYASGTSLAVPFVSGLAALLWAVNPRAQNTQIRDRIIATADKIDLVNLSSCNNNNCVGLLGSGRINAQRALETPIPVQTVINEGDLVRVEGGGTVYLISGGQKQIVSTFVFNQRYQNTYIKTITQQQAVNFADGVYAPPYDQTLVKGAFSPTVYMVLQGKKWPITYQVFKQRNLDFNNVQLVSDLELNSWVTNSFLPFTEGTLVKTDKNSTIYWVIGLSLHPINYNFYIDRGLNLFPITTIPAKDLAGFPRGEPYIR